MKAKRAVHYIMFFILASFWAVVACFGIVAVLLVVGAVGTGIEEDLIQAILVVIYVIDVLVSVLVGTALWTELEAWKDV